MLVVTLLSRPKLGLNTQVSSFGTYSSFSNFSRELPTSIGIYVQKKHTHDVIELVFNYLIMLFMNKM